SDAEAAAASDPVTRILSGTAGLKTDFLPEESRIRDSYDRFLDFLERFGTYVQSGLIAIRELDPYLRYWIDDIAAYTKNLDDAAWTCAFFAYIEFYRYEGVRFLFLAYGYDISIIGALFNTQCAMVDDQEWIGRLKQACRAQKVLPRIKFILREKVV